LARHAEVADLGTSLTVANELAIRRAFEVAGVEFTNGDQPGVRLTKTAATRSAERRREEPEYASGTGNGKRG
jgi:hypothetical protein